MTEGQTGYFRVIPEKVDEFMAWVKTLDTGAPPKVVKGDADNEFAILDCGTMAWEADDGEDIDGIYELAERFLLPGTAVSHAWHSDDDIYAGASYAVRSLNPDDEIQMEYITTYQWLAAKQEEVKRNNIPMDLPA